MLRKTLHGAFLFILGYFLISIISGLSKYLQESHGFSPVELTFFNFLTVLVLTLPWLLRQKLTDVFKTTHFWPIFIRSILGFTCFLSFFTATHKTPLVNAVTLLNTAPLWIPICSFFILKERVSKKALLCVFAGFLGVLMVLHPRLRDMNIEGDLYGLFSGLALAFIMILMRMLKDAPWQKIVLFYSGASVILGGIFMIPSFKMPQGAQWGYLLIMGVCMYLVQYLITVALHFAKASTLSPLIYSSIIFSGIIGWVVWHHIPSTISLIGMLVIVVSGVLVLMFEPSEAEEIEQGTE